MRIAIASSGLGHVARGIETCALLLAHALSRKARHAPGLDVTLFHAVGPIHPITLPNAVGIFCLKRGTVANRWLTWLCSRLGGWRYGFGSAYETEQTTFAPGLIRALRTGRFDIVHLQDPELAWLLEKARRKGRHPAQVILAHGTEETPEYLSRYSNIQELTPAMAERSQSVLCPSHAQKLSTEGAKEAKSPSGQTSDRQPPSKNQPVKWLDRLFVQTIQRNPGVRVWMIPNFVDTTRFTPLRAGEARRNLRRRLTLAPETRVIGCVAALKAGHKRVDYLIDEFTRWSAAVPNPEAYALVILGATTPETPALRDQIARSPARARIWMLADVSYEEMPDYYAGFDLHVLCSLFEVCPMAELEALASGVPGMGHDVAVNRWFFGDSGWVGDLSKPGGLGELLEAWRREQGAEGKEHGVESGRRKRKARERAEQMFSPEAVVPQIVKMYEEVLEK